MHFSVFYGFLVGSYGFDGRVEIRSSFYNRRSGESCGRLNGVQSSSDLEGHFERLEIISVGLRIFLSSASMVFTKSLLFFPTKVTRSPNAFGLGPVGYELFVIGVLC